jgi:hypothetical protein
MKLIKSLTNEKLYYTKYRAHGCEECDISFNLVQNDGELILALSVNRYILGELDILKPSEVKKTYKRFTSNVGDSKRYFNSDMQFSEAMISIARKLQSGDVILEGDKEVKIEFTEEIKEMLTEKDLMNQIDNIIRKSSKKGFVREWDNLATTYLTVLSAKTDNPVNLDLTGATSIGKSYIVVRATIGFNKDFVDVIIGGSKTSYKYQGSMGEDGKFHVQLHGKSIIILESSEAEELIQAFKAIMSHDTEDDEFEIPVTGVNEVTGERETRWIVFHGIPSFILLGTVTLDSDEYLSRTLRASPEISSTKISESVSIGFEKWGRPVKHRVHEKLQILRDSMSWLNKYSTVNIYSSVINEIFPKDDMIRNRDRDKLIGIIESITILHQMQRLKYKDFLMVSFEDNIIGLMLMDKMMDTTFASLPSTSLKVYEIMMEMQNPRPGGTEINLEEVLILERLEAVGNTALTSLKALKEHLGRLLNHHLIEVKNSGRGNTPRSYKLVSRGELSRLKLAPLFIERVAKNIDKIMNEYDDILDECEIPEGETEKSINDMVYFVPENIDTPIYFMTPEKLREKLFSKEHIFEIIGDEKTKEYLIRKKKREEEKESVISGEKYNIAEYIPPDDVLSPEETDMLDDEYEEFLRREGDDE